MSEPPKESQPTEESSRRLAIAKEMYLQGSYNAAKHSTIGSILAVLNMDYSAETIVKSILIEEGVVIAGESFPELCKNLQSRHKKLKLLSAIQDLHKLRNNVQHHGMVPSPQDITRHRNTIRYFFDEVCDVIYDGEIAYDSISLALFIDSSIEKEILQLMENRFALGDYKSAVLFGKRVIAYHLRLLRRNLGIPHSPREAYRTSSGIDQLPGLHELGRTLEDVTRATGWLMSRFVLQDYYEEVSELLDDPSPLSLYAFEQPKLEEADRTRAEDVRNKVYNFLSDTRWKLQDLDLPEPFIYKVVASSTNEYGEVEVGFATKLPAIKCVIDITELGATTQPIEVAGPLTAGIHTVKIPPLQDGKYYTIGLVVENSEGRDYDSFGFQTPA